MTVCLFTPDTAVRCGRPVVVGGRHSLAHGYALALAGERPPPVAHLGLLGTSRLADLLEEVRDRRPRLLVLEHDPTVPGWCELLAEHARAALAPGTPILLVADTDVPAAALVDAVVRPGGEAYLRHLDDLVAAPGAVGGVLASVPQHRFEDLPCPFTTGTFPARAAGSTGIEAVRRGRGGALEARSAERVAADLWAVDERLTRPVLVPLRSAGPADDWAGLPALFDHLVDRPLAAVALGVALSAGGAARIGPAGLAELGVGAVTLHLDAAVDDVFGRDVERTLHGCREQLPLGPGRLRLVVRIPGGGYDAEVQHLSELAQVYGARLEVVSADGGAGSDDPDLDVLQRAIGALVGPGVGGTGGRTLVLDEPGTVLPPRWTVDELGPGWTVFHPPGGGAPLDGVATTATFELCAQPAPGGTELVAAGVPVAAVEAGAAAARRPADEGLRVRTLGCLDDLAAFLAAADASHAGGRLDPDWFHPHVFLGEAHLWQADAVPAEVLLHRVHAGAGGVRALRDGGVLGSLADGRAALVAALERHGDAARAARGCETCPVAATCSRPPELPRWLDAATYCRARRARPWLGTLAQVPAALRRLYELSAALHEPGGLEAVRVSGLGGGLFDPAHTALPERTGVVLVRVGDDHYLYDGDDHCSRVGTDLAAVFEAAHVLDPERLRAWLVRRHGLAAPRQADAVVEAAQAHLSAYGFGLPAEVTA